MNQNAFQRACAWSGIACVTLFFLGFVVASFVPPLSPSLSAAEVAQHYQTHTVGIRVGATLMFVSGMFYAAFTAVISGQMMRIPGVHPTVVWAQGIAGAFACLTFMVPGMLFVVAAFRPDRDPAMTQMLNDFSWIFLVMPWPPFMVQNFAFAFAVASDRRSSPLFPRWLAYLNVWAPIVFMPAVLLPHFKSGPFAWSGIFVIWIPATIFIVQFLVNTRQLLVAVNSDRRPAADKSAPLEAVR
ncbi:hypothetical protein [Nocardioides sp. GCM10030258]|uniref:hypothetical protein n=1 Tax=unclassified Nocardioides TaxID=2615069 RepID=UPI00360682F7